MPQDRRAISPPEFELDIGNKNDGCLIVNADDWGIDVRTTDRILHACLFGAVTSVSGMVFMEDSDRAAELARSKRIETGLHFNCTSRFSAPTAPTKLVEHQELIARYLRKGRFAQVIYNPALVCSFEYIAAAQLDEFRRLYGTDPNRIDGHHHMHLCANVLMQRLLPKGTMVRRSFSFFRGQKNRLNLLYRRAVDKFLIRRHYITDYFFSLPPIETQRLEFIYGLARHSVVELETHPACAVEHRYLTEGQIFADAGDIRMAPPSAAQYVTRAG
jgi:predicted glycoside hydrolase/deacetylase ChbG (UPF0249 family)